MEGRKFRVTILCALSVVVLWFCVYQSTNNYTTFPLPIHLSSYYVRERVVVPLIEFKSQVATAVDLPGIVSRCGKNFRFYHTEWTLLEKKPFVVKHERRRESCIQDYKKSKRIVLYCC